MTIRELIDWQQQGYARNHQSRPNLLLHIILVPLFMLGNVALLAGLLWLFWPLAISGLVASVLAIALQGVGHKGEAVAPEPFSSVANAISRIFLEQWVTFPRFVLTGGWLHALRSVR